MAAYTGPDQQGGSGNASASSAAEGQAPLSAGQLVEVYVLPRPLALPSLAAMNGSLLETQAPGWALRVHAGPPAVEGVSSPWHEAWGTGSRSVRQHRRSPKPLHMPSTDTANTTLHPCGTSLALRQGPPSIGLSVNGTQAPPAAVIDDLSTCGNRTAGAGRAWLGLRGW